MEINMARERKKGKGFLTAFIVMFILVAVGIADSTWGGEEWHEMVLKV